MLSESFLLPPLGQQHVSAAAALCRMCQRKLLSATRVESMVVALLRTVRDAAPAAGLASPVAVAGGGGRDAVATHAEVLVAVLCELVARYHGHATGGRGLEFSRAIALAVDALEGAPALQRRLADVFERTFAAEGLQP
jgi:hypothetical protein